MSDQEREVLYQILGELRGIRRDLIPLAHGKHHMKVIYTLCGVIAALVGWFTGVEPNLPSHAIHLDRDHTR